MKEFHSQNYLLVSLQRALLGNVDKALRQASIEVNASRKIVRILFEYECTLSADAKERLSIVATEVIADFPSGWSLDERHSIARDLLPLTHVGYRRFELKA